MAKHTPQGLCILASCPLTCTAAPQAYRKTCKWATRWVPCFAGGATITKWAGGGDLPSRSRGEPVSSQLFPLSCSTVTWVHQALLTRRRATLDRETVRPRRGEWALEVRGVAGQVARPPPLLPQQQHTPALGPRPAEAPGV